MNTNTRKKHLPSLFPPPPSIYICKITYSTAPPPSFLLSQLLFYPPQHKHTQHYTPPLLSLYTNTKKLFIYTQKLPPLSLTLRSTHTHTHTYLSSIYVPFSLCMQKVFLQNKKPCTYLGLKYSNRTSNNVAYRRIAKHSDSLYQCKIRNVKY